MSPHAGGTRLFGLEASICNMIKRVAVLSPGERLTAIRSWSSDERDVLLSREIRKTHVQQQPIHGRRNLRLLRESLSAPPKPPPCRRAHLPPLPPRPQVLPVRTAVLRGPRICAATRTTQTQKLEVGFVPRQCFRIALAAPQSPAHHANTCSVAAASARTRHKSVAFRCYN